MDDKIASTTNSGKEAPQDAAQQFDDPGDDGGMVVTAADDTATEAPKQDAAAEIAKTPMTSEQADELLKYLRDLNKPAQSTSAEPDEPAPFTLQISDDDMVAAKEIKALASHYNDRLASMNKKNTELSKSLQQVLEAQKTEGEAVELAALIGSLPDESYQEVFTGADGKRNLLLAAKKVQSLRRVYQLEGQQMPTDRQLLNEAAVMLFRDQAAKIAEKIAKRRPSRGIQRATVPASMANGDVRSQAIAAVREKMLELGVPAYGSPDDEFDPGWSPDTLARR